VVVFIGQSKQAGWGGPTGGAPLAALPLTVQQLAALAADRRFDLS
jgi:hypothetical protein